MKKIISIILILIASMTIAVIQLSAKEANQTEKDNPRVKASTHFNQAIMYENFGKLKEAISEYKKALVFMPDSSEILTNLASVYFKTGNDTAAVKELKKALSFNPNYADAHMLLGNFYINELDYKKAIVEYESILRIEPSYKEANFIIGFLYTKTGRDTEATKYLQLAAEDSQNAAVAYYNLGYSFVKRNMMEQAIQAYKKAGQLKPNWYEVHFNLGIIYESIDLDSSIIELEKAKIISPKEIQPYTFLAQAYQRKGILEKVIQNYKDALKIKSNDYVLLVLISATYTAMKNNTEALVFSKKAYEISPEDPAVNYQLGVIYYLLKQSDDSVKYLKQTIKSNPKHAPAMNLLAYIYAEKGTDLDEALKLINNALELEPDNGAFLDTLGWIFLKKGMPDHAITEITKALKTIKDDATIYEHLGDAYSKRGNKNEAIKNWKRSLELNPENKGLKEKISIQ